MMRAPSLKFGRGTPAGESTGDHPPAWLSGKAVGEWFTISGTGSNAYMGAFSGAAWYESGGVVECWDIASGGHVENPSSNPVNSIVLTADAPTWSQRKAPSSTAGWDSTGASGEYMPSDGLPAPRHTYWRNWWVPEQGRFMLFGAYGVGTAANQYFGRNAFSRSPAQWVTPGTYSDVPNGLFPCTRDPATGILYATQGSLRSYDPRVGLGTDANVGFSGSWTGAKRMGTMWDPVRGKMFHLSCGDAWTAGGAINCGQLTTAGVGNAIDFNSSAAWTDFQSNAANLIGHGCAYNQDLDVFYFYGGLSGQTTKIYVITPNAGTTWDMSIMSVTGVTPPVCGAGVWTKFYYSTTLKCILLVAAAVAQGPYNIHALRTQ